jgi:hypothetical protein
LANRYHQISYLSLVSKVANFKRFSKGMGLHFPFKNEVNLRQGYLHTYLGKLFLCKSFFLSAYSTDQIYFKKVRFSLYRADHTAQS